MAIKDSETRSTVIVDEIEALTSGINKNRLFPLIIDILLLGLLASLMILEPHTEAVNGVDVRIMQVLIILFLSALIYFNLRERKNLYLQFRVVIALAIVCVSMLFANAMLGDYGRQISKGGLPWVLPFLPLVVLYIYTFLIDLHARVFFWLFVLINGLFFVLALFLFTPETKHAWVAALWTAGLLFLGAPVSAGFLQLQRNIHGEIVRYMLQEQTAMRTRLLEKNEALVRDHDTGALNLAGVLKSLTANQGTTAQLLCVVIPEHQKMSQALGSEGFNAYCREIKHILAGLRDEVLNVGRPFENVFLAWSESLSIEQVRKHRAFVNELMRPVLYQDQDITPVVTVATLPADRRQLDRDRLQMIILESVREAKA